MSNLFRPKYLIPRCQSLKIGICLPLVEESVEINQSVEINPFFFVAFRKWKVTFLIIWKCSLTRVVFKGKKDPRKNIKL